MHEQMWEQLKRELYARIDTTNEEVGKNICHYFLSLMRKIEESVK